MTLEVGVSYLTKCGNTLICYATAPDEFEYWCVYTTVIEGHEALQGKKQLWADSGYWIKYPQGIHDIVKEL